MPDRSTNRIAKNTLLLYVRMMVMMLISLYTSRVILASLGVADYGIYNVVGSFVGMFSMISGSLTTAINRFLTVEIGKGNILQLKRVFSTSVTVQLILSLIVVAIAESIGLWYVNRVMVIPVERVSAANWCYQFSIVTFVMGLLSVPYNSAIIAHERMSVFASVSIFEAIGKLLIAGIISFSPFDKLVFYGLLLAVFSIVIRLVYILYCKKYFEETHFKYVFDKEMIGQMFGFAGWNFIGAGSRVLRDTGGNLLLNFFFGPAVNAARGISVSVTNAISQFGDNFMIALNPQITKSYAMNDFSYMFRLIFRGARLSVFLLLFISAPIILNCQFVLELWLKEVPEHAALFCQLGIIYTMFEMISYTLVTAMLATGDIKNYQILVGGLQCFNIPIAWFLLHKGCAPETVVLVSIFVAHCCLIARLYMLKGMINLDSKSFFMTVYLKVVLVAILGYLLPLLTKYLLGSDGCFSFILSSMVSLISMGLAIFYIGCDKSERAYVLVKVNEFKMRLLGDDG